MNDSAKEEISRREALHAVWSFVLALTVIIVAVVVGVILFINREKAPQVEVDRALPVVEVQAIEVGAVVPDISSEGVVKSRREVRLATEVSGRVEWISPQWIEGGKCAEGEELVRLDDADLAAAEARAASALADAKLLLEQEEAKGEQARREWERLGRGEPSALTLRKPQIASAAARVASATAELDRARRDVSRAVIRAPFAGRVRLTAVEVGAVLMSGTAVGEMYSDTDLEVRLPVSLRDFGFIDAAETPRFEVSATLGVDRRVWPAEISRVDGEVERSTLSGHVIARILPDEAAGGYPPVGLFVEAAMKGRKIEGVCEVPRAALRGIDELWVVRGDKLAKLKVEEVRSSRESVVVRGPFESGDRLLLTRLAAPVENTRVRIAGEEGK